MYVKWNFGQMTSIILNAKYFISKTFSNKLFQSYYYYAGHLAYIGTEGEILTSIQHSQYTPYA